jgi:hypothetical protein
MVIERREKRKEQRKERRVGGKLEEIEEQSRAEKREKPIR